MLIIWPTPLLRCSCRLRKNGQMYLQPECLFRLHVVYLGARATNALTAVPVIMMPTALFVDSINDM